MRRIKYLGECIVYYAKLFGTLSMAFAALALFCGAFSFLCQGLVPLLSTILVILMIIGYFVLCFNLPWPKEPKFEKETYR